MNHPCAIFVLSIVPQFSFCERKLKPQQSDQRYSLKTRGHWAETDTRGESMTENKTELVLYTSVQGLCSVHE